ncbi:MAG: pseudaminic acid synthase [Bacteroidia bacterium]|nr:pseudaminic acid synthase [Bacteroidia bacterium]
MKLGRTIIGKGQPPFIIAEMSGNHNGSLERALAIVDAAAEAGAHAIKLQTYTADSMTIPMEGGKFTIDDPKSLWHGRTLYELYEEAHTPWEWHEAIFKRAKEKKILCFSSPFDEVAVDKLEKLGCPVYKIASFENEHMPLLKKVARTGKPVIMSAGLINEQNLRQSVHHLQRYGCKDLILLKCTSTYPASASESNLATIPDLEAKFKCTIGLSDHTPGIGVSLAAVALGACVIEKHFTLSRTDGGVDAAFSLEPNELKQLVTEATQAALSIGYVYYDLSKRESQSLQFKRSIYVVKPILAGEKFTERNVRIIRPSGGMEPAHYEFLLGKNATRDLQPGTALTIDCIAKPADEEDRDH